MNKRYLVKEQENEFMPIKIQNDLPARKILEDEHIFVMTERRALTQDIRPLQILLLNLMPTKIETETQILRCLSNTPLQIEVEFLQMASHTAKNISEEHMIAFYQTFPEIKHKWYDGLIITGAPVELMEFEEVEYWDELCEVMEWSKTHVHSTFHICWGLRQDSTIIMVYRNIHWIKSCQVCTSTICSMKNHVYSVDLIRNFTYLIRGIRP